MLRNIAAPSLSALLLLAPSLAFAISTPTTFCELVKFAVTIINALTSLMVFAALALFLWNIVWNLKDVGESREKLKLAMFWGIIALFAMVSIWGILRLLQATLPAMQNPSGAAAC